LAGCTSNPNSIWVTHQARQLAWNLKDDAIDMAFLIHDNDKKFLSSFDIFFSSEWIEIVHTPYQAPRVNAFAERWVRSVREERLDLILILNESHLRCVLKVYTEYYNHSRPHQGIQQRIQGRYEKKGFPMPIGKIESRSVLSGLHHNDTRSAYLTIA
jgi:putative transposase